MQRVFITGIGVVTPVGSTLDSFWNALVNGRCGLRQLQRLDTSGLKVTIGGEVNEIDLSKVDIHDRVSSRKMDRASQYAVQASHDALTDAGFALTDPDDRFGTIIGAGLSGMETLQEQTERLLQRGADRVSPFTIPLLMPNAAAANVSLAFGVRGPAFAVSSACSSSGHALINAFELIRSGQLDVALAGGTEASITRLGIAAFVRMGAMSDRFNDRPEESVRPFAGDRAGLIMSEGSAMLVLESEESLKRRDAAPYAEFVGYGTTQDVHHIVQPDPDARGASAAINAALKSASWNIDQANRMYVNAHGTATTFNDLVETRALKSVFGTHSGDLRMSSTKSMTGHLIGAACAVETAVSALVLKNQVMPPTINYHVPDPECDLNCLPNVAREGEVEFVLNNSFGFGGHNVSLALQSVSVPR